MIRIGCFGQLKKYDVRNARYDYPIEIIKLTLQTAINRFL